MSRRRAWCLTALGLALASAGCGDNSPGQQKADALPVQVGDALDGVRNDAGAADRRDAADAPRDAARTDAADARADRGDARSDAPGDRPDAAGDGDGDARADGAPGMEAGATCTDGAKNGNETDVDCGGSCGRCALGKRCGAAGDCQSGACNASGICVDCLTADTCPGADSECAQRTCLGGACGVRHVAAGTTLATQVAGDCKIRRCDGEGVVTVDREDTDAPDDGNPCTDDVCTNGVPGNPPSGPHATCGAASVCDGQGHCVGCVTASDCPGSDNECRARTCAQNLCGFAYKAPGTASATQDARDCKVSECDGNGGLRVVPLDSDLPDDGDPCSADYCSGGTPSHGPAGAGLACGGGNRCDGAGHCVQCLRAADCPGQDGECQTRTCSAAGVCGLARAGAGAVLPAQTAGDCQVRQCDGAGNAVAVTDTGDRPDDGNACTADVCTGSVPSNPALPPAAPCEGGRRCDGAGHCLARECLVAADCPGQDNACQTRTCSPDGVCGFDRLTSGTPSGAQVVGDCKAVTCDGNGNPVVANDDNDLPVDGNACTADVCAAGVPTNPPLDPETPCEGHNVCDGAGHCFGCLVAADCPGQDTLCQSRTCGIDFQCGVDNVPGGTPVGPQTAGDCKSLRCDGGGNLVSVNDDADVRDDGNACTADTCTAGVPANAARTAGFNCGGTNVCDGFGTCFNGTRPQLPPGQGPNYTVLKYLEKAGSLVNGLVTDNWGVTALAGIGDVSTFTPNFVVQKGTAFPTVQSAVDAAIALGGTTRRFIQIVPDTYREVVCVRSTANTPITIYSTDPDASRTVIVFNNFAGLASTTTGPRNACAAPGATTFGTSASATFAIFSRDVYVKNITFANDFDETNMVNNLQAVALETQADRLIFENVRMLGNQDTLYVKSGNIDTVTRNYFRGCYVEGDVDFVFGRGVQVLDQCEIKYVTNRRGPTNGGDLVSPSTDVRNQYGLLVINSNFTADANAAAGTVALGRAWDEGFNPGAYPPAPPANYPNGQALIRDSVIGAHINRTAPWVAAASTNRPYSFTATATFPANRLFELDNTGPGSAGGTGGGAPTAAAVQTILNANCIGCHSGAGAPQGLDLTNVRAVVGTPSTECVLKNRITAGSSTTSYLVDKVRGAAQDGGCFAGARMPFGGAALAAGDIATITAWIDAGAP